MADLRAVSLGAGVQSTALLLLVLDGKVEADCAIFADTQWEPASVYTHLDRLRALCAEKNFPLHICTRGSLRAISLDPVKDFAAMPLYRLNSDGSKSMGQRQCTYQFKIIPIRRVMRQLLGGKVRGRQADLLMGISMDEIGRAKNANVQWVNNTFPLLDLRWTRDDCKAFLHERGWDAPRSACIGCPFHTDAEWREIRSVPVEWADACDFDRGIRTKGFLHRSMRPLEETPLSPEEAGQGSLFDSFGAECEGYCGL